MSSSRILVLPTCSICQDDEAGRDIVATACGHVFHIGCIRTWDQRQISIGAATKCPSCNVSLRRAGIPTRAKFITLHSLTERDIDDQGVSHIVDRAGNPDTESRLRSSLEEINSLKQSIQELEARIQHLSLEPVALRHERENLSVSLTLLTANKQELEERLLKYSRDLKLERKERQEERITRLMADRKTKTDMERLNEKYRTAKSEAEQLQEHLAKKISENEELQSFVTEFGQEKARYHATEMALRAQLESNIEKFKSARAANQVYQTKLEEMKKKISLMEEKRRATTNSVRRCSKFYPEGSHSPIHSASVRLLSSNRGADLSTLSFKRSVRDTTHQVSHESSKRLRATQAVHHRNSGSSSKEPYRIEIKAEPEDPVLPSSSTLQSSPIRIQQADKDLFLPSLFGKDSLPHPRGSRVQLPQPLQRRQPSASLSAMKFSKPSDKLFALGPKIHHK